ncbi:unnamed protein product [Urochloa humidicola]
MHILQGLVHVILANEWFESNEIKQMQRDINKFADSLTKGASFEDLENQDLIIGSNYTLMTYENCGLLSVRMDVIL